MKTFLRVGFPILLALAAACASSNDATSPASGTGAPSPGPDSTGGGGSSPPGFGGDAGDACRTQCSDDLHQVLTCGSNPQVVQTCAADTGCGPSGCIAACDAAAANRSAIGCDYYAVAPDTANGSRGSCFAAFVVNRWTSPMKVSLVWKGTTIDATPYAYVPNGSGASVTYQPIPPTGIPEGAHAPLPTPASSPASLAPRSHDRTRSTSLPPRLRPRAPGRRLSCASDLGSDPPEVPSRSREPTPPRARAGVTSRTSLFTFRSRAPSNS